MSIEIEVGLENARRVPVTLEVPLPPEPPKGLKSPKVQRLLVAIENGCRGSAASILPITL